MNSKGESLTVGTFVLLAVAVIVALTLLTGGISQGVSTLSNTVTVTDQAVALPAALNTAVTLKGQAVSGVVLTNTSGFVISSGNYTVSNRVLSNGALIATIDLDVAGYNGTNALIDYVYEPFGYDTNGGGRVIAGLIIIFAALAVVVVVLAPIIKNDLFDF